METNHMDMDIADYYWAIAQKIYQEKAKKQAKNYPRPEKLVTVAQPEKLKEEPAQKKQKQTKDFPSNQNYSFKDDDDFQDTYQNKGKEEKSKRSISKQNVANLCYQLNNSKQNNNSCLALAIAFLFNVHFVTNVQY